MKIMDDRKNKIAGDLAAAETAKTDAESIKAEYAAKLAAARQAQAIIDNARKTAQTAHDKILADTKAEQDQIVKTAKEAIALEKSRLSAKFAPMLSILAWLLPARLLNKIRL